MMLLGSSITPGTSTSATWHLVSLIMTTASVSGSCEVVPNYEQPQLSNHHSLWSYCLPLLLFLIIILPGASAFEKSMQPQQHENKLKFPPDDPIMPSILPVKNEKDKSPPKNYTTPHITTTDFSTTNRSKNSSNTSDTSSIQSSPNSSLQTLSRASNKIVTVSPQIAVKQEATSSTGVSGDYEPGLFKVRYPSMDLEDIKSDSLEPELMKTFTEMVAEILSLSENEVTNMELYPGSVIVHFALEEFETLRPASFYFKQLKSAFVKGKLTLVLQGVEYKAGYVGLNSEVYKGDDASPMIEIIIGCTVGGVLLLGLIITISIFLLKYKVQPNRSVHPQNIEHHGTQLNEGPLHSTIFTTHGVNDNFLRNESITPVLSQNNNSQFVDSSTRTTGQHDLPELDKVVTDSPHHFHQF